MLPDDDGAPRSQLEGAPAVLWVGRLVAGKDPLTAVDAFALAAPAICRTRTCTCWPPIATLEAEVRARDRGRSARRRPGSTCTTPCRTTGSARGTRRPTCSSRRAVHEAASYSLHRGDDQRVACRRSPTSRRTGPSSATSARRFAAGRRACRGREPDDAARDDAQGTDRPRDHVDCSHGAVSPTSWSTRTPRHTADWITRWRNDAHMATVLVGALLLPAARSEAAREDEAVPAAEHAARGHGAAQRRHRRGRVRRDARRRRVRVPGQPRPAPTRDRRAVRGQLQLPVEDVPHPHARGRHHDDRHGPRRRLPGRGHAVPTSPTTPRCTSRPAPRRACSARASTPCARWSRAGSAPDPHQSLADIAGVATLARRRRCVTNGRRPIERHPDVFGLPGPRPGRHRGLPRRVAAGARPVLAEHGVHPRLPVLVQLVRQAHLGPALLDALGRRGGRRGASHLASHYQPDHLWFADDIFGLRSDWLAAFADRRAGEPACACRSPCRAAAT